MTLPMTTFDFGDVVLAPVSFTNLIESKKRLAQVEAETGSGLPDFVKDEFGLS